MAPRGRTPGLVLRGTLESSVLSAAAPSDFMGFICTTRETREIELPWVSRIAAAAGRPWQTTELTPEETPDLAAALQRELAEPFGGLSSVAAAKLASFAQAHGVALLLESQGLHLPGPAGVPPLRPDCLRPEFRNLADPLTAPPGAPLARLHEGEPLAARCCSSIERRYPLLDPRHVGPLLGQPPERAAKPSCAKRRAWFPALYQTRRRAYLDAAGAGGSFYVWQWVNLGLFTGSEPLSLQTPEENRRP
ncbi:MAG: asparagine synthase-related protein [Bryobacteraceae bacterium]